MFYPFPPTRGSSSPWGPIQTVEALGPDAVSVITASHGGLRLSPAGFARLPEAIREKLGLKAPITVELPSHER